ncbi:hypothetical protein RJT34_25722 [Clitoria ternatea]|uniref:Uncharacterized protein n=1 Tax=Clitoria ternatea TaxID=43366 RepID=A0AAN9FT94_CLITE
MFDCDISFSTWSCYHYSSAFDILKPRNQKHKYEIWSTILSSEKKIMVTEEAPHSDRGFRARERLIHPACRSPTKS